MEPQPEPLLLYGDQSDVPAPDWAWLERQLSGAGTYWVCPRGSGHPHPRPVWGVWRRPQLHLSIGSPILSRLLTDDPLVAVHLDSGTDVVILEGRFTGHRTDGVILEEYNTKYGWDYTVAAYGDLSVVDAERVLSWRSAGWAGRDGFVQSGRWRF